MPDTFHEQRLASYHTTREDLAVIVGAILNDEIAELAPVKQGYANEVHAVRTKRGPEVIVRIQHEGVSGFEAEAWAMSHARALGVAVPEVLGLTSFEIAGRTHDVMVLQKVAGKALSELPALEPEGVRHVCQQLGAMLERLRQRPVGGFGFVQGPQRWAFSDWHAYAESTLRERERDAPALVQAGLHEREVSQLLEVVGEIAARADLQPVLCHGDIGWDHLFVGDDLELVALIDWGMGQGGSPALDVAVLTMYSPDIDPTWVVRDCSSLGMSEAAFRREVLIWQANTAMGFLGHDMRQGNEDYKDLAVQGMRSLLEAWRSS